MANPADPDWAFPVACRHCAKPLHGEVRFCPYCGGEEAALRVDIGTATATTAATATATATFEPKRWTPGRAEPAPQFAMETAFVPRREVQQRVGFPSVLGASRQSQEDTDTEAPLLGPAAFEWPEGLPAVITVEAKAPKPRLGALLVKPAAIGTALALSVLALVLGPLQASRRSEPERPPEPTARLEQAQSALGRGDLDTAQRELGALTAAYPGHAAVQTLQDELDQREREQAARREQLREAAQKAAQALGLDDLSPSPASSPASSSTALSPLPAPPPVETAAAVPAAPAATVQAPTPCSEALAALALCPQEDARPAPAR